MCGETIITCNMMGRGYGTNTLFNHYWQLRFVAHDVDVKARPSCFLDCNNLFKTNKSHASDNVRCEMAV